MFISIESCSFLSAIQNYHSNKIIKLPVFSLFFSRRCTPGGRIKKKLGTWKLQCDGINIHNNNIDQDPFNCPLINIR